MSYWKSFRIRLLNKILILAFVVVAFLWVIGKVEFQGLPNLTQDETQKEVNKKFKKGSKKANKGK